ncbi:(d)CMP kinase [Lutibaculum baratangense]|uniref:Cytidylate kinase n=1 Tax=Lutibaculum baratangense AMV1 TaxID=631454 RepID=V4RIM3_9HYPH|nr:d(CMP) kinase [Lutibaculum baratangense]ESR25936.1 Cytidylate kinase [Lutibaculum baratangense AMV1]
MIVALDGPAASGKGTLGRRLAQHFGLRHLDTGLLYRAVAYRIIADGGDLDDPATREAAARDLDPATLDPSLLRSSAMGEAASRVAADERVRAALLDVQREFAQRPPGAVIDGRDIGSVVCPDADVKIFVTASPEVRATRRWQELHASSADVSYEEVLDDIRRRDARDAQRAVAPLVPAQDAHLLDTTELDIETAFRAAVDLISAHR